MKKSVFTESCFLDCGPLISIIIPVYNAENHLTRCIDSILKQTYRRLEILLIDDASTDNSSAFLEQYEALDARVHLFKLQKHSGFFHTLQTGAQYAQGKFISVLNAQDYISCDWCRQLLVLAQSNKCDMVASSTCLVSNDNAPQFCVLDPFHIKCFDLRGRAVFSEYMKQNGKSPSFHLIHNKLYHRSLFSKAISLLEAAPSVQDSPWTDIILSCLFWSTASHFMNIHDVIYFCHDQPQLSCYPDSCTKSSIQQFRHIILEAKETLSFVKNYGLSLFHTSDEQNIFDKQYQGWYNHVLNTLNQFSISNSIPQGERILLKYFDPIESFHAPDHYFQSIYTQLSPQFYWIEETLSAIVDPHTQVISFDVFDTLVKRPVLEPTDLFDILSNELNQKFDLNCIDFSVLRRNAEARCREWIHLKYPSYEDITLDEIYDCLQSECTINPSILEWAKKREIELEEEFCTPRRTGKLLYSLAQHAGKRIIICSDMYLSRATVESILQHNAFSGYTDVFVSSEYRMTKASGNLFKLVQSALHIKESHSIVHIGDNWHADIQCAKKVGWQAYHISKASDLLFNQNPSVYSGSAVSRVVWRNNQCIDLKIYTQFLSLRCILGLMASHCFDHPFIHTHPDSDYGVCPDRIGYICLGPHLLAICNWIKDIAIQEQIPTIHFVARDGYLVKQAFDCLNQHGDFHTNYIRLSRKSLLLADVDQPEDLYSILSKTNVYIMTGAKLADYLKPIIPASVFPQIPAILRRHGVLDRKPFNSIESFNAALKVFIEEILDFSMLAAYRQNLKEYFSQMIKPGDFIFDIGYSGRPESALSSLLGYPIGSLYIHTNNDAAMRRQKKNNCRSFCFYHHKPSITGVLREHIMMELGPSTIGYSDQHGQLEPILEAYEEDYATALITHAIQDAALQFITDYQFAFSRYHQMMDIRADDASAWFEDFLHFAKPTDCELFRCVTFEDDFGLGNQVNIVDCWRQEIVQGCPVATTGSMIDDLYIDGYYVKLYRKLNRIFPKGSSRREWIKRIARILIH